MSFENEDLVKLARLARLQLSDSERENFRHDLLNILALADKLQSIPTAGVTPLAHPGSASVELREDIVTEANQREAFLKLAPSTEAGLYLVPRVIE
jgi:aspartyl-tRNA(Asn)/glutamyl-tRNA(Gln) amidotransferase subunit C